jgi:hypothetical protein
METDFSKKIYDTYYNVKDKIVEITLNDNRMLEGKLVSFYHGDKEAAEPFVSQWHFVEKEDIQKYEKGLGISIEGAEDIGIIIRQIDIREIKFKNGS